MEGISNLIFEFNDTQILCGMFQGSKKATPYGGARKLRLTLPPVCRVAVVKKGMSSLQGFHSSQFLVFRRAKFLRCQGFFELLFFATLIVFSSLLKSVFLRKYLLKSLTQKFTKTAPEINVNKRGLKISQISPRVV